MRPTTVSATARPPVVSDQGFWLRELGAVTYPGCAGSAWHGPGRLARSATARRPTPATRTSPALGPRTSPTRPRPTSGWSRARATIAPSPGSASLSASRTTARRSESNVRSPRRLVSRYAVPVDRLVIRGAREHNLRNISLDLPRDRLIVFTGLSGSGKSSLAFDTIYAEGQRRYVESLSAYARQFLGQMDKPDVDFIEGLSPAISIDQKSASRNPRSTVGTITEVYDYLRLLFARIGVPHCPNDGTVITRQTPQQIVDRVLELPEGTRFQVLAPVVRGRKGTYDTLLADLAARASPGPSSTASCTSSPTPSSWPATSSTPSRSWSTGWCAATASSAASPTRSRRPCASPRAWPRSRSWAATTRPAARRRDAHLQPAPGLPDVRAQLRRAGPPELLVQLALRRLRALRRARHPLRGRPRAGRPRPRPLRRPGRPRAVGHGPHPVLRPAARVGVRRLRHRPPTCRWSKLPKKHQKLLLHGTGASGRVQVRYKNRYGRQRSYDARYEGVIPWLQRRHSDAESDSTREQIEGYMREVPCPECGGARLKPVLASASPSTATSIDDLCQMSIAEAAKALVGARAVRARPAHRRAGGQGDQRPHGLPPRRRARLPQPGPLGRHPRRRARPSGSAWPVQIGSGLVGVLYVLDEPSIGLHQRDNRRLIDTLVRLRDLGQHRPGGRARRGDHQGGRPRRRHRPRCGGARRRRRLRRPGEGPAEVQGVAHRPVPLGAQARSPCPSHPPAPERREPAGCAAPASTTSRTSTWSSRSAASWRSRASPARASPPSSTTSSTGP